MNDKEFKVGDNVRVMRKSNRGEVYWGGQMNETIGKVYKIIEVSKWTGNLLLSSGYYHSAASVRKLGAKNAQLVFEFMYE